MRHLLLAVALASAPGELVRFALEGLSAGGEARIEDAYKWLHQASRGGEHAAPSEAAARAWLEREWASLGPPLPGEPLVVPLRPDGAVVRLNLRPWKGAGGSQDLLLQAFLESAREVPDDVAAFREVWTALGRLLGERPRGRLTLAEWRRLDATAGPAGYPAVHHSASFAAARTPAYRVLTGPAAERLRASLGTATPPPGPPRR